MQYLITIIVPIYNAEKSLDRCIQSILKQTYKNMQIILINDGSSDNSERICQKYKEIDKRIEIVNQVNLGVSHARNIGLENSKGRYIGFVDADDYIEEEMFETLIKAIEGVDIAICNYERMMTLEVKKEKDKKKDIKNQLLSKNELLEKIQGKNYFQGFLWNKIYKKEIIDKYEITFKEEITICEDLLFNCQYISKINKGRYIDKKLYNYVYYSNSAYNGEYNEKWESVLDAYKQIFNIYHQEGLGECVELYWNYLIANFDLQQKIKIAKINDKIEKLKIKDNIKKYFYLVVKSKKINKKEKMKLYIKRYCMPMFLIIKSIKYRRKNER